VTTSLEGHVSISSQRIVGVIPARFGSTRFPGKLLASLGDRTILHHVHDRALRARRLDTVIVATDDERILREVLAFGGTAVMTSPNHHSGTDRLAEAVAGLDTDYGFVVNVQGDEPFIDPGTIDAVAAALAEDPASLWTAVCPLDDAAALASPNVVKAVVAEDGRVLYFSRAPIPHLQRGDGPSRIHHHHIGIYGYAKEQLLRFVRMPCSPLERAEGLEQLRALEGGIPVRAVTVGKTFGGIDTQDDLDRARRLLAGVGSQGGKG
jgi:3-deoxy-manno-octulosonate cytidylyltransferase (CMP-KDO synthetase)